VNLVTPSLPFATLLGIQIIESSRDKVLAELQVKEELCTIPAVLHGGAAMSLADTLGAIATVLNLPPGARTTTIERQNKLYCPGAAWIDGAGRVHPDPSRQTDDGVANTHLDVRWPLSSPGYANTNGAGAGLTRL